MSLEWEFKPLFFDLFGKTSNKSPIDWKLCNVFSHTERRLSPELFPCVLKTD